MNAARQDRKPGADKVDRAAERTREDRPEMYLRGNETIDDLQRSGLKILQSDGGFRFGMDAVLLSGFVQAKPGAEVLDLGTGTGILPILLSDKTQAGHFCGLEIQPKSADMALRSVRMNHLEEKIEIIQGDIREADGIFAPASFDIIVTKPPYMAGGCGLTGSDDAKTIARHEVLCSFEDIARVSCRLLRPGGRFFMVHRPARLPELIISLHRHRLEPKRMRIVCPYADREPNLFLLECARDGAPGLRMERPLIVYASPGVYTSEVLDIYGYTPQ